MIINKHNIHIPADPTRVVLLYFQLGLDPSAQRIHTLLAHILSIPESEVQQLVDEVMANFGGRHKELLFFLDHHYDRIKNQLLSPSELSDARKKLIGAYLTKEYSIQSAAVFNPSIVPHPDQSSLNEGEVRFIYSLRSVGEGHISSVEFRSGIIGPKASIHLDEPSHFSTLCLRNESANIDQNRLSTLIKKELGNDSKILDIVQKYHTYIDYQQDLEAGQLDEISIQERAFLNDYFETNYELKALPNSELSERVIFPSSQRESKGIEDVRLVRFEDGSDQFYAGTYTAYDGHRIAPQILITEDFITFRIRQFYGEASSDKGFALFPRRINGRYAMIGRQGGVNLSIMYSEDLLQWDNYTTIYTPGQAWELIQSGNCGSPIETKEGWLVITHGVGPLRTYSIGAILLDINNPMIVTKVYQGPLLQAEGAEREGYVPNVVYSCGAMLHGDHLIIPYALSDSATSFASVSLDLLLSEMTPV